MRLLEEVMEHPPESMHGLADHLERDIHHIHNDIRLLAEHDIIHCEEDGRAKKPFVKSSVCPVEKHDRRIRRKRSPQTGMPSLCGGHC